MYRIKEFASKVGCSTETLRRWQSSGKLVPIHEWGSRPMYTEDDLKKAIEMTAKGQISVKRLGLRKSKDAIAPATTPFVSKLSPSLRYSFPELTRFAPPIPPPPGSLDPLGDRLKYLELKIDQHEKEMSKLYEITSNLLTDNRTLFAAARALLEENKEIKEVIMQMPSIYNQSKVDRLFAESIDDALSAVNALASGESKSNVLNITRQARRPLTNLLNSAVGAARM